MPQAFQFLLQRNPARTIRGPLEAFLLNQAHPNARFIALLKRTSWDQTPQPIAVHRQ